MNSAPGKLSSSSSCSMCASSASAWTKSPLATNASEHCEAVSSPGAASLSGATGAAALRALTLARWAVDGAARLELPGCRAAGAKPNPPLAGLVEGPAFCPRARRLTVATAASAWRTAVDKGGRRDCAFGLGWARAHCLRWFCSTSGLKARAQPGHRSNVWLKSSSAFIAAGGVVQLPLLKICRTGDGASEMRGRCTHARWCRSRRSALKLRAQNWQGNKASAGPVGEKATLSPTNSPREDDPPAASASS
mmetsp:Transcript_60572/g.169180  ORF Transcript_60572/g.169180 Transcript_60572/m.169180 type:complete len:250 (-) Transcript_60572:582-1331(-)